MSFKSVRHLLLKTKGTRYVVKSIRNLLFPQILRDDLCHTISIEISSVCNARCIFCNYRFGYRKKLMMPIDSFSEVVHSAVDLGYTNLDLTSLGGEILLHPEVATIACIAKQAGLRHIGAFTNGILFYRHNIETLLETINVLLVSFPAFDPVVYREIFQVDSYSEFEKSITLLLKKHREMDSSTSIIFEPRTYLTQEEIARSPFYKKVISPYLNERILLREPLRVFDTWGNDIKQKDLPAGMVADINPAKSVWPLKKSYPCCRLFIPGVLVNGDVRLCNCRYNATIETGLDPLVIGNLRDYRSLADLIVVNKGKIDRLLHDFCRGKMPVLCKKCPFYSPVRMPVRQIGLDP